MQVIKKALLACISKFGYGVYRTDGFAVYPTDLFRLTSLSCTVDPEYVNHLKENSKKLISHGLNKAHYGCGDLLFEDGWVNIDFNRDSPDSTEIYIGADLTSKHPFPSNHFCFSFAEDFLEHLTQDESLIFLSEAYRCLNTGGVLRLSFPSLRGILQRHFLISDFDGASLGKEKAFTMWDHKHFYCEESLSIVAKHIGFSNIKYVSYGVSAYEELRCLDSRLDQQDINIYVELSK